VTSVIDVNADVGEGFGDDDKLLGLVSSANVACGFHAGGPSVMRHTCAAAQERGVAIGAHVGYADRAGFGRREIGLTNEEIFDAVVVQVGALAACAATVGGELAHVKPHGALYHRAAAEPGAAAAVIGAMLAVDERLAILGPPRSALEQEAARRSCRMIREGFADRAYREGHRLVPRSQPSSVLDAASAAEQALSIVRRGSVQSICIHGDSPEAVATARAVVEGLAGAGVTVRSFA
jgi:UPF0271 protein